MTELLPGTQAVARGLRWEVVWTQPAGEQTLYRLRCLEGGLRGRELDLLVPFERVEAIATELDPTRPSRIQDWRVYHDAFLLEQEVGPKALVAARPGRLSVAPYQLVPVMRALSLARPRLLLADDVGLGKTIEAGLVLVELIARRRAHRILIVTPAGPLLHQWDAEMRERFGLRFRVLDAAELKRIRFQQELGANPFDHVALALVSIDFAKQERVLQDLERTQYDVVVIDEAHHCARLGAAGDRDDSLRRRLAEVLADRADALLLLTATPHDGNDAHFASIVELLDRSLLDGRGALRGDAYHRNVVRRLKRHITKPDGTPLFLERNVVPEAVLLDPVGAPRFCQLQETLVALVGPRLREALRRRVYADALAFLSLLKRGVSSAAACGATLAVVAQRLGDLAARGEEEQEARRQRIRTLRDLHRRRERFGALTFEEEQDQAELEAEDIASDLAGANVDELAEALGAERRAARRDKRELGAVTKTRDLLASLVDLATQATKEDPKVAKVLDVITAIRSAEPRANVLVYTEYTDSQAALAAALSASSRVTGTVLTLSGADDDVARMALTERFRAEDDLILVSTDASAEGLNLHARCHHLIHLELPYNPNRLEQRNGRIDRFGQEHTPTIHYLYLAGTFEERLLMRLVAKYERQRARLKFAPNTLGGTLADGLVGEKLLEGLAQPVERGAKPIEWSSHEPDDTASSAFRDMLGEIDRVFSAFEKNVKAHRWLGDAGVAAEATKIADAADARAEGARLGAVDLSSFVTRALHTDTGRPESAVLRPDGSWLLHLDANWAHGLEGLPGWDPQSKTLRVTADVEQTRDSDGAPVGFLGRAHPIVRRALDRVRHARFGGGDRLLDRRVAVARGDRDVPEIVWTVLGRVQGGAGRELERVIAVRCARGEEPRADLDAERWIELGSVERAVPTKDVWKLHFGSWARVDAPEAQAAATRAFDPIMREFLSSFTYEMQTEREAVAGWLRSRTEELCGAVLRQQTLFGDDGAELQPWKRAVPDVERVASYASDRANPPRLRGEAQAVLEIHRRRDEAATRRATLEPPLVTALGLLLLVPASARPS